MLIPTLAFFALYSFLSASAEWKFHRTRGISKKESNWRAANSLIIAAGTAYILFVPYDGGLTIGFGALLVLSGVALVMGEVATDFPVTQAERRFHTVISMLHPLMWSWLGATWKFIDGAGFFLRQVLPFSTSNLRPVAFSFFAFMAALSLFQFVYWRRRFSKQSLALVVVPVSESKKTSSQPDTAKVA